MPKRPDYGDATPEDLARAVMRYQRPPTAEKEPGAGNEQPEDLEEQEHDSSSGSISNGSPTGARRSRLMSSPRHRDQLLARSQVIQ